MGSTAWHGHPHLSFKHRFISSGMECYGSGKANTKHTKPPFGWFIHVYTIHFRENRGSLTLSLSCLGCAINEGPRASASGDPQLCQGQMGLERRGNSQYLHRKCHEALDK